jgi:four helix bundle protein
VGVRRFQDLVAWQRCAELSVAVSELTGGLANETLRDQLRDAADSAPALIAEGFKRFTTREFVRYLRMARGELGEVQRDLETSNRKRYFAPDQLEPVVVLARRAIGTTTNLLKSKLRQLEAEERAKRAARSKRRRLR